MKKEKIESLINDKLRKRENSICIYERNFMFCLAGQLYEQAPNRSPRKADVIMNKAKELFREQAYNDNEWYTVNVTSVKDFIKDLLYKIPEFEELNLSQNEYDAGVKLNDESRGEFHFSSRYDVNTADSWRNDIVDLDAFVSNVVRMLVAYDEIEDNDCFTCIHDKKVKNAEDIRKCNHCRRNRKLKIVDNYEGTRQPKGEFTMACKYDCFKNYYICCCECDDKATCEKACKHDPENCGNVYDQSKEKGVKHIE